MAGGCGSGRACARLSLAFKAAREREGSAGVAVVRSIEGRPWQRRGQVRGRPVRAPRRRGGASPCSCRGVSVNGQGAAGTACALKWRGRQWRGTAGQQGSEAARARQRRSTAASARATAFKCLRPRRQGRASGGERGEREREWREKTQGQLFDLAQTHDFQ